MSTNKRELNMDPNNSDFLSSLCNIRSTMSLEQEVRAARCVKPQSCSWREGVMNTVPGWRGGGGVSSFTCNRHINETPNAQCCGVLRAVAVMQESEVLNRLWDLNRQPYDYSSGSLNAKTDISLPVRTFLFILFLVLQYTRACINSTATIQHLPVKCV